MSKKDPRRALAIRVPIALRRKIEAITPSGRPFAARVRQVLRLALAQGRLPLATEPGDMRPTLLQLTAKERAAVMGDGNDLEREVLGVIAAFLVSRQTDVATKAKAK